MTEPQLPDGTPFPTLYYLTCPRVTSAIGTLEADGVMREMAGRLVDDAELAGAYRAAHEAYLAQREQLGHVEHIAGISAGGMPDRVKCLHVLVAHSLAAGPGVNPLGDEALAALPEWWAAGPCVQVDRVAGDGTRGGDRRAGDGSVAEGGEAVPCRVTASEERA